VPGNSVHIDLNFTDLVFLCINTTTRVDDPHSAYVTSIDNLELDDRTTPQLRFPPLNGPNQAPDGGATGMLLGMGVLSAAGLRRWFAR
jgi:hypothetical protein